MLFVLLAQASTAVHDYYNFLTTHFIGPRLFVAYYSPMLIELSPLSNQPLTSCYLLLVFDTIIFNDFFFTIVSGLTLSIIHTRITECSVYV